MLVDGVLMQCEEFKFPSKGRKTLLGVGWGFACSFGKMSTMFVFPWVLDAH